MRSDGNENGGSWAPLAGAQATRVLYIVRVAAGGAREGVREFLHGCGKADFGKTPAMLDEVAQQQTAGVWK